MRPTRRHVLAGGAGAALGAALVAALPSLLSPRPGRAAGAVEITWDDLIPGGADPMRHTLDDLGINDWGEVLGMIEEPDAGAVVAALDGRRVRLPGYVVPLAFEGTGTTEFLLVPYVGACIHVPPPPPNQIVLVASETPYETEGYFEAVWVTGTMRTTAMSTELAEVGYALAADRVEPYEG
jgi:hypothetical protein